MDIITIEPMILEIFKSFTLQNGNLQIYVVDFCFFHKMNHLKIYTPCFISTTTFVEVKESHFYYGLFCVLDYHMFIFFIDCHQFLIYDNFNISLERRNLFFICCCYIGGSFNYCFNKNVLNYSCESSTNIRRNLIIND
jgi:hypothetical protein